MHSPSRRIVWGWLFLLALACGYRTSAGFAQEAGSGAGSSSPGDSAIAVPATDASIPLARSGALPGGEGAEAGTKASTPFGFMLDWFRTGGAFMWPLLLCAIVGVAVSLERVWTLQRARIDGAEFTGQVTDALKAGGVEAAIQVCRRTRGPIASMLQAGLLRARQGPEAVEKAIESAGTVELAFLQRGLLVLATVTNVAPLLGFLGTVSGMIHAFEAIAAAEQVSAKLVASGIAEALITTEAGLCIAIPIQSFTNFFISRIDRFVLEMEEVSIQVVDTLVELKEQGRL